MKLANRPIKKPSDCLKAPVIKPKNKFMHYTMSVFKHHYLWLTCLLAGITFSAFPQKQSFKFGHLPTDKGLSQSVVQCIYKDSKGLMWFGTRDGLNKYDGNAFTVYKHDPDNEKSISNSHICDIFEDQAGNFWVCTRSGLNRYDRKKNNFIHFDLGKETGVHTNNIIQDLKGNLWLGTRKGLFLINSITGSYKAYLHDDNNDKSISSDDIVRVVEDFNGDLWIATVYGLNRFNIKTETFTRYLNNPEDPKSINSNRVTVLYIDRKNNILIGTEGKGLSQFDRRSNTFKVWESTNSQCNFTDTYVISISEGINNQLWIGTENDGFFTYDYDSKTTLCYKNDVNNNTSLANNSIRYIYKDDQDNMWLGTYSAGVEFLPKLGEKFTHIMLSNSGLNNNIVKAILQDNDDNVWLATDGGGINFFNEKDNVFHYLQNDKSNPNTISSNTSHCIAALNDDVLVFGHHRGGFDFYDKKTKKITHFLPDEKNPNTVASLTVAGLHKDSDGNLWLATWSGGLDFYDISTKQFKHFPPDPTNPKSISNELVYTIKADKDGNLWLGTNYGVEFFDRSTEQFTHYLCDTTKTQKITSNSVICIHIDKKNNVWAGTSGGGLNLLDKKNKTFTTFKEKDGLPNNVIEGILEDSKGHLWISTNNGISKFDPEKKTFRNYGIEDGVQGNEFKRNSSFKNKKGEMFFGGVNGYNVFHPDSIKDNPLIPNIIFTEFQIFNKKVEVGDLDSLLKEDISEVKEIKLAYYYSVFTFKFAALNYTNSDKNKYAYMLEGFDNEWNYIGTEKKATYTNIDAGEYILKVKACNNDGIWNEQGVAIKITIVPPFWKTWWFITLIITAIISSVLGYIRYQRIKAKRQQAELSAIIEERTREVKAQSAEINKKYEEEKVHNWITQGLAAVSETMSKNSSDLNELGTETLKKVIRYINAQQGLIALGIKEQPADEHLKILATYGTSKERFNTDRVEIGEGLLGETYKNKEKRIISHIPEGYFKIESGLGDALPSKIILMPLRTDDGEIIGVMEVAFFESETDVIETFLDKVSSLMALNFYAVTLTHKAMILLQQSKEQTEEIRAQEEEMRQNMEELEATQEEYKRREMEFQRKIEELETKIRHLTTK